MSYVQLDDKHEGGRLSEFRERLSGEVRIQTGEEFPIFQDRSDVEWGQKWKERAEGSIDAATFLIPIVTPALFKSKQCRAELERFLERERKLGREDLILTVHYVPCPELLDEDKRQGDKLAMTLADRQWADWRQLRFEPFGSSEARREVARMAQQIVEALNRPKAAQTSSMSAQPSARTDVRQDLVDGDLDDLLQRAAALARDTSVEPPTRTVDAMHRGDYSTITAAIAAADPGDRVVVRSGFYREELVISKPLEIVGESGPDETVIQSDGTALFFSANIGRVSGLRLEAKGDRTAVSISDGRLDLENCDVIGGEGPCIVIGGSCEPRIRACQIHGGGTFGILIVGQSRATIEDNEIFDNIGDQILATENAVPIIRGNNMHGGGDGGVFCMGHVNCLIEDNDIVEMAGAGISVFPDGRATARRNRITQSECGIRVVGGTGSAEQNDLRGNLQGSWDIREPESRQFKRDANLED